MPSELLLPEVLTLLCLYSNGTHSPLSSAVRCLPAGLPVLIRAECQILFPMNTAYYLIQRGMRGSDE
jgi:hypothetical protein